MLKYGLIGTKLSELISYLEYFDLSSWFEDWLSRAPDLRLALSVQVTVDSEQNSFGR
jgi:hypothetical protein